jgi:Flp pilus assembly protein TadD
MDEQVAGIVRELERAETLIELRRFDEAASTLHRLLGHDPENGRGWCLLAQAQLARGDFAAARNAADHAVAVAPEWEWGHRLRSIALRETGRNDLAVAAAYEAVRLAPEEWLTHTSLSQALAKLGSGQDAAIASAERAVALAPNESDAHLTLGNALAARDRRDEAEAAYLHALALDPENSAAHNNLARIQLPKGRFRFSGLGDAAKGFQRAIRTNPHGSISTQNLDLTIRAFLARLSYLILVIDFFIFWWLHVGSVYIVALLAAPVTWSVLFVARIGSGLRRHVWHTVTHGLIGLAMVFQLGGVVAMLYVVVAPPANRLGTAALAFGVSLAARLILKEEMKQFARR